MQKIQLTYNINKWNTEFSRSTWTRFFTLAELENYANKKSAGSLVARYLLKMQLIDFNFADDFLKIEVLNTKSGKPSLQISGVDNKEMLHIHFSLSHSKSDVAVLLVID